MGRTVLNSLGGSASEPLSTADNPQPVAERPAPVSRLAVWRARIYLVIFVIFCIELGLLLAVLPWTRLWTENELLLSYPVLRTIAHNTFLRGAISGLGLIDVWLGIWEAVHYHDPKPEPPQPPPPPVQAV